MSKYNKDYAVCPRCKSVIAHQITEEVDIGVGIQIYFVGIDCGICGKQSMKCQGCGCWLELEEHKTGASTEQTCIACL